MSDLSKSIFSERAGLVSATTLAVVLASGCTTAPTTEGFQSKVYDPRIGDFVIDERVGAKRVIIPSRTFSEAAEEAAENETSDTTVLKDVFCDVDTDSRTRLSTISLRLASELPHFVATEFKVSVLSGRYVPTDETVITKNDDRYDVTNMSADASDCYLTFEGSDIQIVIDRGDIRDALEHLPLLGKRL